MSLINIELIFVYSKTWEFNSSLYGQSTLPSTIYQRISFLQCMSSLSKKCVYKSMFLTLGSLVCSFGLFNVHVRSGIITPSALFFILRIALVISFHTVFGSLFFCIFVKDVF